MELSDLYARQSGVVPIDPQVLLALCVGLIARSQLSHAWTSCETCLRLCNIVNSHRSVSAGNL